MTKKRLDGLNKNMKTKDYTTNLSLSEFFGVPYTPMEEEPMDFENNGSISHKYFKTEAFKIHMKERMNDPETKQKLSDAGKSAWQDTKFRTKALQHITNLNLKAWVFTHPDGTKIHASNLSRFCRDHGLVENKMRAVAKGHKKTHRGFSVSEALTNPPIPL
jgi:hypothetical protein